jgi:hypothetical protein
MGVKSRIRVKSLRVGVEKYISVILKEITLKGRGVTMVETNFSILYTKYRSFLRWVQ